MPNSTTISGTPKKTLGRNWRSKKSEFHFADDSQIEYIFSRYYRIKAKIAEKKASVVYYSGGSRGDGGSPSQGKHSDPTAMIAIRNQEVDCVVLFQGMACEEVVYHPERWVCVVEQTLDYFDRNNAIVSEILRKKFLRNEGWVRTCVELEVSKNKYYRAKSIGIKYARECAIQLGLIKVF